MPIESNDGMMMLMPMVSTGCLAMTIPILKYNQINDYIQSFLYKDI